ncbi:MAG: ATP-binding protein [Treponema sp.]|nr:ATP-binding protein [Treponema sp.]
MQRMLCGTENISLLRYGKPGSGKTEYAKALAKASGLKPLTQEGIRCMLDRYFHAYSFSESDIARFERRSSVMPGDFGALAGRMRFMDKNEISASYIADELCKMQDEKDGAGNTRIGFSL